MHLTVVDAPNSSGGVNAGVQMSVFKPFVLDTSPPSFSPGCLVTPKDTQSIESTISGKTTTRRKSISRDLGRASKARPAFGSFQKSHLPFRHK